MNENLSTQRKPSNLTVSSLLSSKTEESHTLISVIVVVLEKTFDPTTRSYFPIYSKSFFHDLSSRQQLSSLFPGWMGGKIIPERRFPCQLSQLLIHFGGHTRIISCRSHQQQPYVICFHFHPARETIYTKG